MGDSANWHIAEKEPAAVVALRGALAFAAECGSFECTCVASPQEFLCEYWDAMNAVLETCEEDYAQGMRLRELAPGIFHVEFSHQLLMASTMVRIQERYECPGDSLRGRSFTLD